MRLETHVFDISFSGGSYIFDPMTVRPEEVQVLFFTSWVRRFLSRPQDEPGFLVTERFIIRGEIADRILFHGPDGWVDDRDCAVVFIRRDAAEITRWRLKEDGCGKITNVCVERIA